MINIQEYYCNCNTHACDEKKAMFVRDLYLGVRIEA